MHELISLNEWLKSLGEFMISISSLNNNNNISVNCDDCLLNKLNESNCNTFKLFDQSTLFNSFVPKFFLTKLNGNFFKLKHLYSFLNDCILELEQQVLLTKKSTLYEPFSHFQNQLNSPFEHNSPESLLLLDEIYKFLHLPCTFNLFKLALFKYNNNKKYLLFNINNNYLNDNNDLIEILDDKKYNTTENSTNNNNDDNFANMNRKSMNDNNLAPQSQSLNT